MGKYFSRLANRIGHIAGSTKALSRPNVIPSSYEATKGIEKHSGVEVNLEKTTISDKEHNTSITKNTFPSYKNKNVVPLSTIHTDSKVESVSQVKPQKTVKVKGPVIQHNEFGKRSETENPSKASDKDKYDKEIEKIKPEAFVSQSAKSSKQNKSNNPCPTKKLIRQKSDTFINKEKKVLSTPDQKKHSIDIKTYFETRKTPLIYKQPELPIKQTQKSSVDINIGTISVEVYQEKQKVLQTPSSIQQNTIVYNTQPSRSPRLSRYYLRDL